MFFFCFFVSLQGEIGYGRTKRNADGCARLLHAGAICYPFTSLLGQVKKKDMFLVRISIKKKGTGWRFFFCYLLFPIPCFLHTLLPSPRIRWTLRTMSFVF